MYMASKVAAEKALWRFAGERKPHFTVNVVAPASILGQPLNRPHSEGPTVWLRQLYDGNSTVLAKMPASK